MTREEHISNLETIGCDGWTVTTEAYKSLQFAIKVLEQEPCDDATLKDIFCMGCEYKEQEPKTGHWIKYGVPRCGEQHYKCTSCGYYINFGQWGELYTKEFKFCPNCGARMEGEDKG